MEKIRSQINNTKYVKGIHITVPKNILSRRPCLDVKEIEILSESDVLENIQKGIVTGFEIRAVEHKECC